MDGTMTDERTTREREAHGAPSDPEAARSRQSSIAQWKGVAALVTDAVVGGASAIERVHLAVASRPFDVLEQIPVVAAPAGMVRVVHDLSTRASYASVRGVARLVGRVVDVALDCA